MFHVQGSAGAVVRVDLPGIREGIDRFEEDYDDLYLIFRPLTDPATAEPDFRAAVEWANQRSQERVGQTDPGNQVGGQGGDSTPNGPTVWFDMPAGDDENVLWLTDLAQHLADAGRAGLIEAHSG
jgi:hypothetical protein